MYCVHTEKCLATETEGFSETKPCCYFSAVRRVMLYCGAGQQAPSDPQHPYTRPTCQTLAVGGENPVGACRAGGGRLVNPGLKSSGEGRRNGGSGEG